MSQKRLDSWRVAAAYFILIGCGFALTSVAVSHPHGSIRARLEARQNDTIGVADVINSVESGNLGKPGLAALILLGPAVEMFRTPIALWLASALLMLIAFALNGHSVIGAIGGASWQVLLLGLSCFAATQISVSYSLAARLFMFGPAMVVNLIVLVVLWRLLRLHSV